MVGGGNSHEVVVSAQETRVRATRAHVACGRRASMWHSLVFSCWSSHAGELSCIRIHAHNFCNIICSPFRKICVLGLWTGYALSFCFTITSSRFFGLERERHLPALKQGVTAAQSNTFLFTSVETTMGTFIRRTRENVKN